MVKSKKIIIGSVEAYHFPDLGIMDMNALNDTGAKTSSLHAEKIRIVNLEGETEEYDPKKDQFVYFKTGHKNDLTEVTLPLKEVREVKRSSGESRPRPVVDMLLQYPDGSINEVEITLTNRNSLRRPLLIGREAMRGKAIVDVAHRHIFKKKNYKHPSSLVVGRSEYCSILELGMQNIRARVDTGAGKSSVHASNIRMDDDGFVTFETEHDGRRSSHRYPVVETRKIKRLSGKAELRPVIRVEVSLSNETHVIDLGLTDRQRSDKPSQSAMSYPMLLGRDLLKKFNFLVDSDDIRTLGLPSEPDPTPVDSDISRYNPTGIAPEEVSNFDKKLRHHELMIRKRQIEDELAGVTRPKILLIMDSHRIIAFKERKRIAREGLSIDDAVMFSTAAHLLALERAGFDVDVMPYGRDKVSLGDDSYELVFQKPDYIMTHPDTGKPILGLSDRPQIGYIEEVVDLRDYVGVVPHIATKTAPLGLEILRRCEKNGLVVMQTSAQVKTAKSKVKTDTLFRKNGVDTPETVVVETEEDLEKARHMLEKERSVIVKADAGGAGDAVEKAETFEELKEIINRFTDLTPSIVVREIKSVVRHPRRVTFDRLQADPAVVEGQWRLVSDMRPPFRVWAEGEVKSLQISSRNMLTELVEDLLLDHERVVIEDVPRPRSSERAKTTTIQPNMVVSKVSAQKLKGEAPYYVEYRRPGGQEIVQIRAEKHIEVLEAIRELRRLGRKEKPKTDILVQEMLASTPPRHYQHIPAGSSTQEVQKAFNDEQHFAPPYLVKAQFGDALDATYDVETLCHTSEQAIKEVQSRLKKDANIVRVMGVDKTQPHNANDRRIIAVRDEKGEYHLLAVLDRSADAGQIKANISKGGKGIIRPVIDLTDAEYELAIKAAKASGLGITGVDIMGDPPRVLEVNDSMAIGRYGNAVHDKVASYLKARIFVQRSDVAQFFNTK